MPKEQVAKSKVVGCRVENWLRVRYCAVCEVAKVSKGCNRLSLH